MKFGMMRSAHGARGKEILLLAGLLLSLGAAADAQDSAAGPALKANQSVSLRAFEPDANEEYKLGRGDEISIDIAGRPELSRKYTVGPDGRVTLPLAGPLLMVDESRQEAAKAVEQALGGFYSQVSATVSVDRYTSNHVLLLGAVEHPGLQTFEQPPTLLEVISRGGMLTGLGTSGSLGGQTGSQVRSVAVPDRCAIYRGADQVMWVELKSLLDNGSSIADLRLKRGDIVYVPSPSDRSISILGQVQHPGAVVLDNNSTLPKLLAEAGGITELAGRYPDIQIIQPSTGKTRVVSFKSILQPSALDLTLHPGDIVFVPESGFNRVTYVFQRLSPLVTAFAASALFIQ